MANATYNEFKKVIGEAGLNWASDTIKVILIDDTIAPNIDTHEYYDDITTELTTGDGYTAGGATLADCAITRDDTADHSEYDATDVTWGSSTITARYGIVYKDTGTPATSPLICYMDFTENKSSSAGDFKITWHADGVFKIA